MRLPLPLLICARKYGTHAYLHQNAYNCATFNTSSNTRRTKAFFKGFCGSTAKTQTTASVSITWGLLGIHQAPCLIFYITSPFNLKT